MKVGDEEEGKTYMTVDVTKSLKLRSCSSREKEKECVVATKALLNIEISKRLRLAIGPFKELGNLEMDVKALQYIFTNDGDKRYSSILHIEL